MAGLKMPFRALQGRRKREAAGGAEPRPQARAADADEAGGDGMVRRVLRPPEDVKFPARLRCRICPWDGTRKYMNHRDWYRAYEAHVNSPRHQRREWAFVGAVPA